MADLGLSLMCNKKAFHIVWKCDGFNRYDNCLLLTP